MLTNAIQEIRLINVLRRIGTNNYDEHLIVTFFLNMLKIFRRTTLIVRITNEYNRIHANITNDLKRTFTNDNESG